MKEEKKVLSPKRYRFSDINSQDLRCPDYIEGDKFCCCIYGIKRKSDGKIIYVGQTKNLRMRIKDHYISVNETNKAHPLPIDIWMAEHRGEYEYVILKKFEANYMNKWEKHFIKKHNTLRNSPDDENGFNTFLPDLDPERQKKMKAAGNKRWYDKKKKDLESWSLMNEASRNWYKENPDINSRKMRKYRAKKLGYNESHPLWELLEKHDFRMMPAKKEAKKLGIKY